MLFKVNKYMQKAKKAGAWPQPAWQADIAAAGLQVFTLEKNTPAYSFIS
jgi:hypothetical protein